MKNLASIQTKLREFHDDKSLTNLYRKGHSLYLNAQIVSLSHSDKFDEFLVIDQYEDFRVRQLYHEALTSTCSCKSPVVCAHRIAALFQAHEDLAREVDQDLKPGVVYTREGMIKRVLKERFEKARKANYKIVLSDNRFGEHILSNEREQSYRITLHDLNRRTGYCTCPDYKKNKLGTCKHLIWTYRFLHQHKELLETKSSEYPFIEIYRNPLNDYKISWYYPGRVPEPEISALLFQYFDEDLSLKPRMEAGFLNFLHEVENFKQVLVRDEVYEYIERRFQEVTLKKKRETTPLNYDLLKKPPYLFQRTGIEFLTFNERAILADEIGLGKTYQAIGAAIFKQQILGFSKCLVVCPASLLGHWAEEIKRFTGSDACVLSKSPEKRLQQYDEVKSYFYLINYEKLSRDKEALRRFAPDLLILDEAQRLKNYDSQLVHHCQSIPFKHIVALSGTPIDKKLSELYTLMYIVDPERLSPLWEFSYQHYYFDPDKEDEVLGYHSLDKLKEKIAPVLLRRTKKSVWKDLPEMIEINIPVPMQVTQLEWQKDHLLGLRKILEKKIKTPFDHQAIFRMFNKLRMVANSDFLLHGEPSEIPKLDELREILLNKLNLREQKQKIVIFSDWKSLNLMIARMLRSEGIGMVELHGEVPVDKRSDLLKEFNENPECLVFLSSATGSLGLNLQEADTLINFDIPWKRSQWEQRIGRIDRMGQKSSRIRIINLISTPSIETSIKQRLTEYDRLFSAFSEDEKTSQLELFPAEMKLPDWLTEWVDTLLNEEQIDTEFPGSGQSLWTLSEYEQLRNGNQDTAPFQITQEEPEPEPAEQTESTSSTMQSILINSLEMANQLSLLQTGKALFSGKPEIEEKDNTWLIRIRPVQGE